MKKKPLRILSIDDNLSCQLVAARFLTFIGGHMVEVAENGREGLKKAAELKPDIILLDMSMPDMNGAEVIEALYAAPATRDIPVIMITGTSLSGAELTRIRSNSNFIHLEQKPANFTKLLKRIEATLLPDMLSTERQEIFSEGFSEPA